MEKAQQKKKGFTLLEMVVVVGIISLLVTTGFVSYSTAEKKARDSKRKTDLVEIQTALEQYYSLCNFAYPTQPANALVPTPIICGANTLMQKVPVDPKTG